MICRVAGGQRCNRESSPPRLPLAFVAFAQEPGNPDHKEPAPGWFCSPTGAGAHECHCKRMGDPHDSCESVTEEPVCKVYCFKDLAGARSSAR